MNFNDEHNTKSTILSDITTVNDTCNTNTANFTNYNDYNICDHELDLDPYNISLYDKLAIVNIILMRYLQNKLILQMEFL